MVKKNLMKKIFMAIISISFMLNSCASAKAQTTKITGDEPYWFNLENGKVHFRRGDFGSALVCFEDARSQRQIMYYRMERSMVSVLSIDEVRHFGDDLERVERYIIERSQLDAKEALDELYFRVGKENLGNSTQEALRHFVELQAYPEADFWIAEIYRIEGELDVALREYRKAYAARALLESADDAILYQYKIAEVDKLRQDYFDMEKTLLDIASHNTLWAEDDNGFVRRAMSRTLENEGINRFLTIYRHKDNMTEKAHRLLGHYYYESGRYKNALDQFTFSFLSVSTTVIDEVIRQKYDFQFTTLHALMEELRRRPELRNYLKQVEYYRTMYYMAGALYADGKQASARELWNFLSDTPEADEWSRRSMQQLWRPFIDLG
jgi:tetratricopeptide (TPR) repeat protein